VVVHRAHRPGSAAVVEAGAREQPCWLSCLSSSPTGCVCGRCTEEARC